MLHPVARTVKALQLAAIKETGKFPETLEVSSNFFVEARRFYDSRPEWVKAVDWRYRERYPNGVLIRGTVLLRGSV